MAFLTPECADLVLAPDAAKHEWDAVRATGLGGSDVIGAIPGGTRYMTPYRLWLIKTGRWGGPPQTAAMTRGKVMEDMVAELWTQNTGMPTVKTGTWRRRDREHELGNPDRFTEDGGLLEIKTTASVEANAAWIDGGRWTPTLSATCQVQWYMNVTGASHAYLTLLPAGADQVFWEIPRDQPTIDALRVAAERMWDLIVSDTPPPVDGSKATREAITGAYRVGEREETVRDERLGGLFAERARLKDELKAPTEKLGDVENEIKSIMGEASVALNADGVKVGTWNTHHKTRFDLDAFRDQYPELYAQFSSERPERTLRTVKVKPAREPKGV